MPDHVNTVDVQVKSDYWSVTAEELCRNLGTTLKGLSEAEAELRLRSFGYNELPTAKFSGMKILVRQFKNPLFVILFIAAIVSGFFEIGSQ